MNKSNLLNCGIYQRGMSKNYQDIQLDGDTITLSTIQKKSSDIKVEINKIEENIENQTHINTIYKEQQDIHKQKLSEIKEQNNESIIKQENSGLNQNNQSQMNQSQMNQSTSESSQSISSVSTSKSGFFSSLFKSKQDPEKPVSKKDTILSFYNKAKEKLDEAKSSIKIGAKNLMFDINQTVHDHENQMKLQMLKEDIRIKANEAKEVIGEQTTHLKDYATTTYQSVKQKIKDKMKEKKVEKEIKEIKTNLREKYKVFEVATENYASQKVTQIKNFFQQENIDDNEYEKIEFSESEESNEKNQQVDKKDLNKVEEDEEEEEESKSENNAQINTYQNKSIIFKKDSEICESIFDAKSIINYGKESSVNEQSILLSLQPSMSITPFQNKVLFLDEQPSQLNNDNNVEQESIFGNGDQEYSYQPQNNQEK